MITTDGLITFSIFVLILLILITIWFIPVFCSKDNENFKKILWINIFLGWIPLVWIALLIAALLGRKKDSNNV